MTSTPKIFTKGTRFLVIGENGFRLVRVVVFFDPGDSIFVAFDTSNNSIQSFAETITMKDGEIKIRLDAVVIFGSPEVLRVTPTDFTLCKVFFLDSISVDLYVSFRLGTRFVTISRFPHSFNYLRSHLGILNTAIRFYVI